MFPLCFPCILTVSSFLKCIFHMFSTQKVIEARNLLTENGNWKINTPLKLRVCDHVYVPNACRSVHMVSPDTVVAVGLVDSPRCHLSPLGWRPCHTTRYTHSRELSPSCNSWLRHFLQTEQPCFWHLTITKVCETWKIEIRLNWQDETQSLRLEGKAICWVEHQTSKEESWEVGVVWRVWHIWPLGENATKRDKKAVRAAIARSIPESSLG